MNETTSTSKPWVCDRCGAPAYSRMYGPSETITRCPKCLSIYASELATLRDQAAVMANYARAISAHCVFRLAGYCRGDCRGRDVCKTEELEVLHTTKVDLDYQRMVMAGRVVALHEAKRRGTYAPTFKPEEDQDHEL